MPRASSGVATSKPRSRMMRTARSTIWAFLQPAGVLDDPVSLSFVMGMDKISQGAISFSEENIDFMIRKLRH